MTVLKTVFTLLLVLIPTTGWCLDIRYTLDVKIYPERQEIVGSGLISSPGPADFELSLAALQDVRVNGRPVTPDGNQMISIRLTARDRIRIIFRVHEPLP